MGYETLKLNQTGRCCGAKCICVEAIRNDLHMNCHSVLKMPVTQVTNQLIICDAWQLMTCIMKYVTDLCHESKLCLQQCNDIKRFCKGAMHLCWLWMLKLNSDDIICVSAQWVIGILNDKHVILICRISNVDSLFAVDFLWHSKLLSVSNFLPQVLKF